MGPVYTIGLTKKFMWGFFCKIKDTLFTFSNNFIDLDVLSMLSISCMV